MLATTIVNRVLPYEKFSNIKLQDYVNDINVFVTKTIEALVQSIAHFQYDDEAEDVTTCLLELISYGEESSKASNYMAFVDAVLTDKSVENSTLLLTLATFAFNHVPAQLSTTKFDIVKKITQYADECGLIESLMSAFKTSSEWSQKWKFTSQQMQEITVLIAEALRRAGFFDAAQNHLITYLSSLESVSNEELEIAKPITLLAAANYIASPAVSQKSNLPSLMAVKYLEKDPDYGVVNQLVDIFDHGNYSDFIEFIKANPKVLDLLNISEEDASEAMRLLTISSIAANLPSPIPYQQIADAIQVQLDQVESWVVKALNTDLLEAKINQPTQTINVTRSIQREFSTKHWQDLQENLQKWISVVDEVLEVVDTTSKTA